MLAKESDVRVEFLKYASKVTTRDAGREPMRSLDNAICPAARQEYGYVEV